MDSPLVDIQGLTKRYGEFPACDALTLQVPRGELFALLGPNGAGKTTTIRMLMGILKPNGGSARIDGLDCFEERVEVKRRVGYLPDEPIFYDYLKGREILRFCGEMHGFSRAEIDARTMPLLERLELADATEEFAVNYSKGMKKKLALICAMLHDPALLILDEPTNGLDPYATRTLLEIVREKAAQGRTVFFSTHLLDQAERLCHRTAIIYKGRLAADGTLAELRASAREGSSLEEIFFSVTGGEASGVNGNAAGATPLLAAPEPPAIRAVAPAASTSSLDVPASSAGPGSAGFSAPAPDAADEGPLS